MQSETHGEEQMHVWQNQGPGFPLQKEARSKEGLEEQEPQERSLKDNGQAQACLQVRCGEEGSSQGKLSEDPSASQVISPEILTGGLQ